MLIRNTFHNYGLVSKVFHNLRFLLLVIIYTFQIVSLFKPSGTLFKLHMEIGMLLLLVMLLNILWNIFNKNPMSYTFTKTGEFLEKLITYLIYICLIAVPIMGFSAYSLFIYEKLSYTMNFNYSGFYILGIKLLPDWSVKLYGEMINMIFHDGVSYVRGGIVIYHQILAVIILPFLLAMHIIALLYSQLIKKQSIIKHMFW